CESRECAGGDEPNSVCDDNKLRHHEHNRKPSQRYRNWIQREWVDFAVDLGSWTGPGLQRFFRTASCGNSNWQRDDCERCHKSVLKYRALGYRSDSGVSGVESFQPVLWKRTDRHEPNAFRNADAFG